MKIYIIRHSESVDDVLHRYGGAADWDITENGIKTAEKFLPVFDSFGVQKVYTSPLKRSYKTADVLTKNKNLPVEKVYDLRVDSIDGMFTGVENDLVPELFGYLMERPEYAGAGYYQRKSVPGGEPVPVLDKRLKKALKYCVKASKNLNAIAIVSHSALFKSFYFNVLKDKREILDIKDCAYFEVDYTKGKFKVLKEEGIIFA